MSEVIGSMGEFEFSALLQSVLVERQAEAPAGMEQRLRARLAQAAEPHTMAAGFFGFAERVRPRRSSRAMGCAIVAHALVLLAIFAVASAHMQVLLPKRSALVEVTSPPVVLPVAQSARQVGGGGGQHDDGPAAQGRLPRFAKEQIVPLKAPPMESPKLAVEQALDVQKDLKMATNTLPNFGMPNSSNKGISMGNGTGTGIGSGNGSGVGRGSGGNTGGGLYHLGSGVQAPTVLVESEAEFSEEARKAKFSGSVQVYLWVEADGTPSHVRVVRGVGMGLDEKAVEAVRKYKFRPATKDGKPVAVDLYIDVNFEIM